VEATHWLQEIERLQQPAAQTVLAGAMASVPIDVGMALN
jgi:hypothetical protein